MLLDRDKYPTQSRARKAIRQRSICIRRCNARSDDDAGDDAGDASSSSSSSVAPDSTSFDELGKVITRVYPGDVIGFQRRVGSDYYAAQDTPYRAPPFDVPVIYEDDYMAVVNKPAGVVMYRAQGGRGGGGRDTLLSALPYVLKPSNVVTNNSSGDEHNGDDDDDDDDDDDTQSLKRPQPVHRLDRPTSGLMVIAKTKPALVHLSQQFELRKIKKTYMAIVNGSPQQPATSTDENKKAVLAALLPSSDDEWNSIDYDLEEKSAKTKWRVVRTVRSLRGNDDKLTLVELKPETGRYHQLRRHMVSLFYDWNF